MVEGMDISGKLLQSRLGLMESVVTAILTLVGLTNPKASTPTFVQRVARSLLYTENQKEVMRVVIVAEQLEQDITVLDKNTDEYFPVGSIVKETETDVLDKGHVVLTINQ
jgi:hypothetical protein